MSRQKARIIGRQGKTKAHISELTGAAVSLKGKHVAIVGRMEEALVAKDAVEALARGLPHGVVYKAVEKKCSSMKMQRNVEMWRQK
jgi:ribosomal RNA assembly protein